MNASNAKPAWPKQAWRAQPAQAKNIAGQKPQDRPLAAQAKSTLGPSQKQQGEQPFWVFIVAALVMAGVAFTVISAGMQKGSEPIVLPATNGSGGNATGGAAYPRIGEPDLSEAYYVGAPGANVTFVEYSDFQCPYCARALPAIEQAMKENPGVRFVFRHYPLDIHQNARKAAEAAECAGKQGKFWQMHDAMFASQESLAASDLKKYANALGMDDSEFAKCLDSGETAGAVNAEKQEGYGAGIRGTPGFLVYSKSDASDSLQKRLMAVSDRFRGLGARSAVLGINGAGMGIVFAGAMPYSDYQSVIDAFAPGPD